MVEKKNRTLIPNRILWIYSAHDSTIINLLDSLQLYNYALVPYAALLMFELRLNSTGSHVITVSFVRISNKYIKQFSKKKKPIQKFDRVIDSLSKNVIIIYFFL